ncbi:MAG: RNA polymerase sigma-54 factor RpoN [Burkholderiaceae bacterium]|jgi:RNA polymerase sigma-54 factor|nr:MAG: RNA polymerase sigma-54 factor RpoN [Burkholderiaceae bacterium]
MKQGLSLRVSQHLALTPQLQQSIRLLQLSTLELSQEVGQMLDDNPFLELSDDAAPREEFGLGQADVKAVEDDERDTPIASNNIADSPKNTEASALDDAETSAQTADQEPSWDGDGTSEVRPDDTEWGGDAPVHGRDPDAADATELAGDEESLQSYLHRQALGLRLSEEDRAALRFLIESLDDDGYLTDSLDLLAQGLAGGDEVEKQELVQRFTVALSLLQHLEPAGVGARSLGECLSVQLQAIESADPGDDAARLDAILVAQRICAQPIELLARRDLRRLSQLCRADEAQIKAAITLITRLEPKPGRRFVSVERNVVVPDVIVTRVGGDGPPRFRVQLNPDVMPRLRVHHFYANALRQHKSGGAGAADCAALQQRLQEARWFIKNIQQRFDTILRVATAIVERQKSFLVHGELAMRPLVLREIADQLGLHESTISRVTSAKYMATPQGTFELKYFFGSGLGTESGGNASSTAVRALIRQFVAAEAPEQPLSDAQLADLLKEQGIACARRTVAKYRDALRIAPANLRRAL